MTSFNKDLDTIPWDSIRYLDTVTDMVTCFNAYVTELFNCHAPVKKVLCRDKHKPWLTSNVRLMMKLRDSAHAKSKKHDNVVLRDEYKRLKHLVNVGMHFEKKAYFEYNINKKIKDSKSLWSNLKKTALPNTKVNSLPLSVNDPDKINDHFLKTPGIDEVRISDLTYFEHHRCGSSTFNLKPVDTLTVGKIMLQIKSNALGIDNISKDMMLLTLPRTLDIITFIINKSIESSTFPAIWKTAVVCPIPKVTNPSNLSDLRPISILPFLSKVLERIVHLQVSYYLEANNILPPFQSGFRKRRGTITALLDVVDNVLAAMDKGNGTLLTLLDFSRAFECLNINLLLSKLRYYGFDEQTIL
ncbi:uncharacterized protein LOC131848983 [Achroia grisella]|uniref:uncharacterized protein LOC131848983 n=1 Tax=Achroia grisella TaxID=688607 RepID=UPI0027D30D9F|nr:uncharacterized protein LOC131848983 [Achroia grisella]